ncbi:MAG: HAMP domain-containing protein, partial [Armatimonadetes bacterium]|nr:HAMP domain-containing protein [Armatimonadota bacterium]
MNWFINLSTRAKLLLSFGLMFLFLAGVIVTAVQGFTAIDDAKSTVVDLMAARNSINGQRAALLMMMLDPTRQAAGLQDISKRSQDDEETLQRLRDRNGKDVAFLSRLEGLSTLHRDFAQARDTQLIPLISAGKIADAKALALGPQEDRYQQMRSLSEQFNRDMAAKARRQIAQYEWTFGIICLAALVLSIGIVTFLNRIIATPLKEISVVAEQIAAGDISVDLASLSSARRSDEVGMLTQTF